MSNTSNKRHWSFVVCDKRYLYTLAITLILVGLFAAFRLGDATQLNRVGNFIVGIGVWMSMRYTLREGIEKHKDLADSHPVYPGTNQVNANFFNQITFSLGDAWLQIHGFFLVVIGSTLGSYGDILLKCIFPKIFP